MNDHSVWYLGLAALSLLTLGYACWSVRKVREPLLLFGVVISYGYCIETVIYNFLSSYRYDPDLIHWNAYYDSNTGAIASNALSLPVAAVAIAVLGLGWRGIIGFTLLFGCIEWLFLKLGIYEHYWWRIGYTMLGLPFYFGAAVWLYPRLARPIRGGLHKLVLYMLTSAIAGSLHIAPIMLFGARSYHPGWFKELGHDTTVFANVLYLSISLFYVMITFIRWRHVWVKYVCAAAVAQTITILLRATGLLKSQLWWDGLYYVVLALLMTWITGALHKQLLRE